MACLLTSGRAKVCKDGLGGQSTLYLFDSLPDAFTVSNGEATAMNVLLTAAFAYPLEGDGNTLEQSMVGDRNTSSQSKYSNAYNRFKSYGRSDKC